LREIVSLCSWDGYLQLIDLDLDAPVYEIRPHLFGIFEVEFASSEEAKKVVIVQASVKICVISGLDDGPELFKGGLLLFGTVSRKAELDGCYPVYFFLSFLLFSIRFNK